MLLSFVSTQVTIENRGEMIVSEPVLTVHSRSQTFQQQRLTNCHKPSVRLSLCCVDMRVARKTRKHEALFKNTE